MPNRDFMPVSATVIHITKPRSYIRSSCCQKANICIWHNPIPKIYTPPDLSFLFFRSFQSPALTMITFASSPLPPPSWLALEDGLGIGHILPFLAGRGVPSSAINLLFPVSSAGQGIICGTPTTRKDTIAVVEKKEVVRRERGGWMRNGIVV